MRKTSVLTWLLAWTWYLLRYVLIGGTISFLCFRYGQFLAGAIVLAITLLLVIVGIVARARDFAKARARAAARRAANAEVSQRL